jgi:hypothetical protein
VCPSCFETPRIAPLPFIPARESRAKDWVPSFRGDERMVRAT